VKDIKWVVYRLRTLGYSFFDNDKLKTAPRGWNLDHPDIEFLQLRKIAIYKTFTVQESLQDKIVDTIKTGFMEIKKFNFALDKYVGASKIYTKKH
jgi:uncharacterized protein (DUF2461 family)